uniref:Mitochondrial inner membrane protease subunit 2 n=1 Tax=Eptatretus burgeri TaxID=7764 RepID=A0A8C4R829_EPTBU
MKEESCILCKGEQVYKTPKVAHCFQHWALLSGLLVKVVIPSLNKDSLTSQTCLPGENEAIYCQENNACSAGRIGHASQLWLIGENVVTILTRSPRNPDQKMIKRVIALEGDIVRTMGYKKQYVKVPSGHCWIEGDHRGHSMDSNAFGPVSLGLMHARASHIVWPPSRWQRLQSSLPSDRRPLHDMEHMDPKYSLSL